MYDNQISYILRSYIYSRNWIELEIFDKGIDGEIDIFMRELDRGMLIGYNPEVIIANFHWLSMLFGSEWLVDPSSREDEIIFNSLTDMI